ncbi:MAG: class I SAM-dependent rRNA methyltransferase [Myxococcaceae bacterium]|nr:class I SAM-dependent rRNA methyltransferase [Myxococcaceae bacterium]
MEARLRELLVARRQRLPAETTCFRWVDGELPGVTVDVFGEVGVLSFYRDAGPDEPGRLGTAVLGAGALAGVYVKHRPKEARRTATVDAAAVAPPAPIAGRAVESLIVQEGGLSFVIRPANGLSVGLYLDARDARAWVRAHARGRRVLNLFAYTCGFGVAARVGGASRAANVDASRKVLDWGEENLVTNGFTPERYDFIAGDAFDWLARLGKKGEQFDLVVLDPPGFATTKVSRFTAARDYHQLVAAAEPVVASRGLLLSMCNVEAMTAKELEGQVQRGLAARRSTLVRSFGASDVDFAQPSALKCLVHELG